MPTFVFPPSTYLPIAIGFFGLGYFIWGGQALTGYPASSPEVNRTMGMWGLWMPGFMQFITGIVLLIGLTWLNVFGHTPPLYMAARRCGDQCLREQFSIRRSNRNSCGMNSAGASEIALRLLQFFRKR